MINVTSIPIKLPIKATNTVVIFDEPLTIFDPGAKGENSLAIIEKILKAKDKTLKDIKRIFLTHGHIDHFGCVEDLRKISNPEVFLHEHDFDKAFRDQTGSNLYNRAYKDLLKKHGSPEIGIKGIDDFLKYIEIFYTPLSSATPIPKKITFESTELEVIETPGHTHGSVVFYNKDDGILISGDTVIKEISPNPVIEITKEGEVFSSVSSFRDSICLLDNYTYKRIIPGHGEEITNFKEVFNFYQKSWNNREEKIKEGFRLYGELSAYDMMKYVFGELGGFEIFLGMSEIIGYFYYLKSIGLIDFNENDALIKACPTDLFS